MAAYVNLDGTLGRTTTTGFSSITNGSIYTVTFPRDVSGCYPTVSPLNNLNLVAAQVLSVSGSDIVVGSTNVAAHGLIPSAFFISVYCVA